MPALYYRRFPGVRNFLLAMAYLSVLGLQSHHRYYQFSSLVALRWAGHTRKAAITPVVSSADQKLDKVSKKVLLLDKRFVQEHIVFLPAPLFSLTVTWSGIELPGCYHLRYVWASAQKCRSRGPPFSLLL